MQRETIGPFDDIFVDFWIYWRRSFGVENLARLWNEFSLFNWFIESYRLYALI